MKKLLVLTAAVALLSAVFCAPAPAQANMAMGPSCPVISTLGWLWELQARAALAPATNLQYLKPFYARYGSTSLSCQATVNSVPKSGVPVSFVGSTLWGGTRSASTKTSYQGIGAITTNWPADVYEMVVKSTDGSISSPAALTIYNSALNTTFAGGSLILGTERRRATFGLRYSTTPSVLSGLLFLDPNYPGGFTKITSTSFRRMAAPAGTRKYAGVCTFQGPGQPPVGANLFVTTGTQTTGYTFSIKVIAVWMEVLYDVSGTTVNGGAKWGP
jgi:hypothetical protein